MKRLCESGSEAPFHLRFVLRNVFVFCRVKVVDVDPLFKSNQSEGYRLLEAVVQACIEARLITFRESKSIHSSIRKLFSEWVSDSSAREPTAEIYTSMKENKFPNDLNVLRDFVQRHHQGLLEQHDSERPLSHLVSHVLDSETEGLSFVSATREDAELFVQGPLQIVSATSLRFEAKKTPSALRVAESHVAFNILGNNSCGTLDSDGEENAKSKQVQFTILDRRLANGRAEYKVQDGGWLPPYDLSTDCIRAFETKAGIQIIDAKLVRDELWVKILWRDCMECISSVMKFESVFNGLALLEQWAPQAKMSYNLKKAVDMQRMARSNFNITPTNRQELLDFEEERVDNKFCVLNGLSESEQTVKLSMLEKPARHMMIAISLYCGEHESRAVSKQQLWDHFCVVNMVDCPSREIRFRFAQAVEECCKHKLLDKCSGNENFAVLLGKNVVMAALTYCTGGPLRELTLLAKQYEFN